MSIDFLTSKHHDTMYVQVRGSLDARSADALRAELRQLAASATGIEVVFDMQQVTFMDSIGVAALITGMKTIQQNGGKMVYTRVPPPVMRVFQITLLDQFLTFVDPPEEMTSSEL